MGRHPAGSPRRPPGAVAWRPGSRCLSATGIRFLGILSRRGIPPLSRSAYRASTARTPTGFPRSAHARHGRGGRPLHPEASGVHTTDVGSPVAACRLSQRPGPTTRIFVPSFRAHHHEASSGVHSRSPVRPSPRPVVPPDGTGALGLLPRASHPRQAGPAGARRGGDRARTLIRNYASGMTGLQCARSLNMRDLVSHLTAGGRRRRAHRRERPRDR